MSSMMKPAYLKIAPAPAQRVDLHGAANEPMAASQHADVCGYVNASSSQQLVGALHNPFHQSQSMVSGGSNSLFPGNKLGTGGAYLNVRPNSLSFGNSQVLSSNSNAKRIEIPYGTKTMNRAMSFSKNQNLSKRLLDETVSHSVVTLDGQDGMDRRPARPQQQPKESNPKLSAPTPCQSILASHRHSHDNARINNIESQLRAWNDGRSLQNTELLVSRNPKYRVRQEVVRALSESVAERVNTLSASVELLQSAQFDHGQQFVLLATSLKTQVVDEVKRQMEFAQGMLEQSFTALLTAAMTTYGSDEKKRLNHLETTLKQSLNEVQHSLQQHLDCSLISAASGSRRLVLHKNVSVGTDMEQVLTCNSLSTAAGAVVDSNIDDLLPRKRPLRTNKRSHPDPKEYNQGISPRTYPKRRASAVQAASSIKSCEDLERWNVQDGVPSKDKPTKRMQAGKAGRAADTNLDTKCRLADLSNAAAGKPKKKSRNPRPKRKSKRSPKASMRKTRASLQTKNSEPAAATAREAITVLPTTEQSAMIEEECRDDDDRWDLFLENPSFGESQILEILDEDFEGIPYQDKKSARIRRTITRSVAKSPDSEFF